MAVVEHACAVQSALARTLRCSEPRTISSVWPSWESATKTESGTAETTDSLCPHTLLSPKRLPGAPRILSRFSDTPHSAKSSPSPDSSWRRLLLPIRTPLFRATAFHTSHLEKGTEAMTKRNELLDLLRAQPADFQINWRFRGTRHFLATDPRFAVSRTRLLQLLDALEQPNRAAIETALAAACWPTP